MWRRPDGRALVSTVDFFTPIVDDPRTWGRIAATNAVSDVYAMGGTPMFALNIAAWPREKLDLDLLAEVMAGGADAAQAGAWVVAGGHTVDAPEPMYGQAVTGEVDPAKMMTTSGISAGDALVLTKPIGTGLLATAIKRSDALAIGAGGELEAGYRTAVAEMTRLNDIAARVALAAGATGATDITGFGLLGHLHRMALASGIEAVVHTETVPLLPGTRALLDGNFVPGGTVRNVDYVTPHLEGGSDDDRTILADAQTSGGLLFGCPPDQVTLALAELADSGHTAAAVGEARKGEPGRITLA